MHPDHAGYTKYMGTARHENAVNTLLGILHGIAMDSRIDNREIGLLETWIREHSEFRHKHPFTELIPVLECSLIDEYLDEEERTDLIWICEKLRSTEYYNSTTADIQYLHGILGGIISDGLITQLELKQLSEWIDDHDHIKGCWPYDEVSSVITGVLADGRIDESEQHMLKSFFSDFVGVPLDLSATDAPVAKTSSIHGLCAVCPEILFHNSLFCFTGTSSKYSRKELHQIVEQLHGIPSKSVTQDLNYLVIGSGVNPCWAYACYGRKVERAVALRKQGFKLLLVHENDFHDAVADSKAR